MEFLSCFDKPITVKELKELLNKYDDDQNILFYLEREIDKKDFDKISFEDVNTKDANNISSLTDLALTECSDNLIKIENIDGSPCKQALVFNFFAYAQDKQGNMIIEKEKI